METKGTYNISPKPTEAHDIKSRLNDPSTRKQALLDTAEWVKTTALYFGATPATAYKVAAVFIEELEKDL